MRVALSPFAPSISASAARPWSILCPAQLTASGNILGKVFFKRMPTGRGTCRPKAGLASDLFQVSVTKRWNSLGSEWIEGHYPWFGLVQMPARKREIMLVLRSPSRPRRTFIGLAGFDPNSHAIGEGTALRKKGQP
jgi:hypothetical protein